MELRNLNDPVGKLCVLPYSPPDADELLHGIVGQFMGMSIGDIGKMIVQGPDGSVTMNLPNGPDVTTNSANLRILAGDAEYSAWCGAKQAWLAFCALCVRVFRMFYPREIAEQQVDELAAIAAPPADGGNMNQTSVVLKGNVDARQLQLVVSCIAGLLNKGQTFDEANLSALAGYCATALERLCAGVILPPAENETDAEHAAWIFPVIVAFGNGLVPELADEIFLSAQPKLIAFLHNAIVHDLIPLNEIVDEIARLPSSLQKILLETRPGQISLLSALCFSGADGSEVALRATLSIIRSLRDDVAAREAIRDTLTTLVNVDITDVAKTCFERYFPEGKISGFEFVERAADGWRVTRAES
ncbi:MAG: hypothetical protein LBB38_00195 [Puniceicoccales bacterium]|nr:hypothetical protein [Puniceicoccales bacterium]